MASTAAAVGVVVAFAVAASTVTAAPRSDWHTGACHGNEPDATTIVVDFQRLDGNDGRAAQTVIRCLSQRSDGAKRTGIDALQSIGLRIVGVGSSTDFVCRISGRPGPTEQLPTGGDDPHVEACASTPPTSAYWAYWTAPRLGAAWMYESLGASARFVEPGGVEGWSFSLGVAANKAPKPEAVVEGIAPPVAPGPGSVPEPDPTPAPLPAPSRPAPPVRPSPAPQPAEPAPVEPAPDVPNSNPAVSTVVADAAGWLVGELSRDATMPGPSGTTDWGLTMDALLALHAASAQPDDATRILQALEANVDELAGADADDAGLAAKLLVTLAASAVDPTDIGDVDVRERAMTLLHDDDEANTFTRSLAVIGLARSGSVPAEVLELLRRQQCSNGSFRVEPATPTSSCSGDPDATSIAVQAYAVAGEPADRALDWLLDQQQPEGSFRGSATTPEPNANSTGLATQALQAGIELQRDDPSAADRFRQARDRATSWTADLARGTAASAAGVNGAIAYDQDAATRAGSVDDTDAQRDQWRRATAQGILALAPVPLGRIGSARLQDASATAAAAGPVDADDAAEPSAQLLLLAAALALGALVASVTILVRRRTRNRESR